MKDIQAEQKQFIEENVHRYVNSGTGLKTAARQINDLFRQKYAEDAVVGVGRDTFLLI